MPTRPFRIVVLTSMLVIAGTLAGEARQKRRTPHRPAPAAQRKSAAHAGAPTLPCGDYVGFQVLLDRQGFSPGQIDGAPGVNLTRALDAFRGAKGLSTTGAPDCDTWHALGGDSGESTLSTYTVADDDVNGPFAEEIPPDLVAQAKLPALTYKSAIELLGERFHASPALLKKLNPNASFGGGDTIQVPAVEPFDPNASPKPTAPGDVSISVTRDDSALRVTRDGTIVLYAPVTTGSIHDPLPTGDYKVTGVSWHPVFHYNPDLFWDAHPHDEKAAIKPGPNNPVGVVWIALSLEHYGIHGTPEPGHIGHTESHGCVRLTNWDAAHVAALVSRGTPVQFR